ncbi:MAG: tRNA threonylcarbamoyladenosine dehydratase [Fusobacterium sp.]|nr:tRNA threonylcarbamoyladenosine dehydratase [Fusobacterium sp.]
MELFSRNILYWGEEFQKDLASKNICIMGLGGVGGYTAEMLARAGVGRLTLVDFDTVSTSNINRQIIALQSCVGEKKTTLFEQRLKNINPNLEITSVDDFYSENLELDLTQFDFVVDAIDSMRSKIHLLETCHKLGVPVISSMGAGNRVDPTQLYICDISEIENKNAPFVSNILYQLKKRGIETGITVVASREKPFSQEKISELEHIETKSGEIVEFNKIIPSSTPFVASTAGIFMAYHIIKVLMK